jgi:hypothetical protein
MTENVGRSEGADLPSKNLGRRKLLQMLTAGGGLAAAGMVPAAWSSPVADVLTGASPAAAGVAPSPTPSGSVLPSVTVSPSGSVPPPTPSVQPGVVNATPPFTG